jgi:hypothetical protein
MYIYINFLIFVTLKFSPQNNVYAQWAYEHTIGRYATDYIYIVYVALGRSGYLHYNCPIAPSLATFCINYNIQSFNTL